MGGTDRPPDLTVIIPALGGRGRRTSVSLRTELKASQGYVARPRLQNKASPKPKTGPKGPEAHQEGRQLCHAVVMEAEGQGSGTSSVFGTRGLSYCRTAYVLYLSQAPPPLGLKSG